MAITLPFASSTRNKVSAAALRTTSRVYCWVVWPFAETVIETVVAIADSLKAIVAVVISIVGALSLICTVASSAAVATTVMVLTCGTVTVWLRVVASNSNAIGSPAALRSIANNKSSGPLITRRTTVSVVTRITLRSSARTVISMVLLPSMS